MKYQTWWCKLSVCIWVFLAGSEVASQPWGGQYERDRKYAIELFEEISDLPKIFTPVDPSNPYAITIGLSNLGGQTHPVRTARLVDKRWPQRAREIMLKGLVIHRCDVIVAYSTVITSRVDGPRQLEAEFYDVYHFRLHQIADINIQHSDRHHFDFDGGSMPRDHYRLNIQTRPGRAFVYNEIRGRDRDFVPRSRSFHTDSISMYLTTDTSFGTRARMQEFMTIFDRLRNHVYCTELDLSRDPNLPPKNLPPNPTYLDFNSG